MPFINTKANVAISKQQQDSIKAKFGKAIELIPGKSENWLMVGFEPECSLYFRGNSNQKIAFVEVKVLGKASKSAFDKLTEAISNILKEELGIEQIYIKYEEAAVWGYNGFNF